MFDATLRPAKDRLLLPVVRRGAARFHPLAWTAGALVLGLGAAVAASAGKDALAVALWLGNRLLDGIDGAVARHAAATSALGGYLDQLGDTVAYTAVPIGLAVATDRSAAWAACAVLLGAFYVNTVSWAYLSALLTGRGHRSTTRPTLTQIPMPAGLIEGAETVVAYTFVLAVPSLFVPWCVTFGALVAVTVGQRVIWAARNLKRNGS